MHEYYQIEQHIAILKFLNQFDGIFLLFLLLWSCRKIFDSCKVTYFAYNLSFIIYKECLLEFGSIIYQPLGLATARERKGENAQARYYL